MQVWKSKTSKTFRTEVLNCLDIEWNCLFTAAPPPRSPVMSDQPLTPLTLVPYGNTRNFTHIFFIHSWLWYETKYFDFYIYEGLRISEFPVLAQTEENRIWKNTMFSAHSQYQFGWSYLMKYKTKWEDMLIFLINLKFLLIERSLIF
jgi:hypothetical protein